MIVSVASGKGGTGKTTVAVALALSKGYCQFFDYDVEAPNASFFIKPIIKHQQKVTIKHPYFLTEKKADFSKCAQFCHYNAVAVAGEEVIFFPELCHGCGGCSLLCPQKAITEVNKDIGVVEKGIAGELKFVHGILNIGEMMAPPLVRAVKRNIDEAKTVVIDAPPGTSCPVIEAIKGSNFCILVTEPTPFGLNDLFLAVEVVRKLKIPFGVVINRANLGDEKVDQYCADENIQILMRIPFDREIAVAYSKGIPLTDAKKEYLKKFGMMYQLIQNSVHED